MNANRDDKQDPPQTGDTRPAPEPQALSFDALSKGATEITIEHKGQRYRLRTTRNGGLILNK